MAIARTGGTNKVDAESRGKTEQNNNRKRLGMKQNTFSSEELDRIKKAMANEEDIETVAKEMGRSCTSVRLKIYHLRESAGLKKGKFSVEEVERMKLAVENNEDYKSVATGLSRTPMSVNRKMLLMKCNPVTQLKCKGFSFEEDIHVLDIVIPRLEFQKLSSSGFLSQSVWMELAQVTGRNVVSTVNHWERILQPWLLQHYTGTTGFRIERMLTSLVAEKYNDHKGIDWSEIVNRHKEFVGHTGASINQIYHHLRVQASVKDGKKDVSLQEVAEYAAKVYQPGKERKESAARALHREKIISYFKERVAELEINVVV